MVVFHSLIHTPFCHIIGECIIIHMFFVFIGTEYVVDVIPFLLSVPFQAASPEDAGIKQYLVAGFLHEIFVPGNHIILPHGKGNVCCYVLLNKSAQDFCGLSGHNISCSPNRSNLSIIGPCRFPWIHGSFITILSGFFTGTRQGIVPVPQESPGNLGKSVSKEGQDKYFGIPE